MSYDVETLYQLLPAIYRIRDAEREEVLKAFLTVLAEQAEVVEEDIARLYDNWFIETCDEWVVPYIGDLLGVRNLHSIGEKAAFSQRARVANTLSYRRRKGTAAMLEQLAHDTTGWDARIVEFFKLLGTTQHMNHLRLNNHRSPDIRKSEKLEFLDTPFDTITHTADVRHIDNRRGKHNIPNIGIYLWRLQAYPVREAPAFNLKNGKFTFSQLGNDMQLFNHPRTEETITHLAEVTNVPTPISRRAFFSSKELYYGSDKDKSLYIKVGDKGIEPGKIIPCDLSGWGYMPPDGMVAVDPVLGRIAFPKEFKSSDVQVCYYYGFSSEVGGGFYERRTSILQSRENIKQYDIGKSNEIKYKTVKKAIESWTSDGRPNAVFCIKDNQVYDKNNEELNFIIRRGKTLEIKADNEKRPVLHLTKNINITGETGTEDQPGGQIIFDGLLIAGSGIKIQDGDLGYLQLRDCTLVPGIDINLDGTPKNKKQESLVVEGGNAYLNVNIDRCITGSLNLENANCLSVTDSIIDGRGGSAIDGPSVSISIEESTVLGSVSVRSIKLGSNSIFTGNVTVEREQEGCMRFCYFPNGSTVPQQYNCQPDTEIQRTVKKEFDAALVKNLGMTPQEKEKLETKISEEIQVWLKPFFTALHYGHPGYGQLHFQCTDKIRTGADDEAEMGVFHHLKQPQREANLRASLEEYLRVGLEAGIFYVT